MVKKKTPKQLFKLLIILLALYFLLKVFLIPMITSESFQVFIARIGIWGYLVVILYTVLSHVFAPLAGSPGVLLGVTIYGLQSGIVLLYFASLISASVNFWISKRYGRDFVTKLVGKKSMEDVDAFVEAEGRETLIISRLFGFPIFEFISYAAGLTTMKFKQYFVITAVASIVPNFVAFYAFRSTDFQSENGIYIWLGSLILAGALFAVFIRMYLKRQKSIN